MDKEKEEEITVEEYNSHTLMNWQDRLNKLKSGAIIIIGLNKDSEECCLFTTMQMTNIEVAAILTTMAKEALTGEEGRFRAITDKPN